MVAVIDSAERGAGGGTVINGRLMEYREKKIGASRRE